MTGYQTHRTESPALVRLFRSDALSDAAFFVLILAAGVAIDGLLFILAHVVQLMTN